MCIKNSMKKIRVGQRIIKTCISVFLCMVVTHLLGCNPFYAVITAVLCMQKDLETSKVFSTNRIIGTLAGGVMGLITVIVRDYLNIPEHSIFIDYIFYSIAIVPLILWTVNKQFKGASFVSTVVYFSIVLLNVADRTPFTAVFYRVVETLIGIMISLGVNAIPFWLKEKFKT